jgi:hypothetical protein
LRLPFHDLVFFGRKIHPAKKHETVLKRNDPALAIASAKIGL